MLAVRAYQLGVMLGGGLLPLLLERRAKAGREDPARLDERKARNMAPRPAGNLVWLHAASVGETRSALPLLADFLPPGRTHIFSSQREHELGNTGRPVKARKFSRY